MEKQRAAEGLAATTMEEGSRSRDGLVVKLKRARWVRLEMEKARRMGVVAHD